MKLKVRNGQLINLEDNVVLATMTEEGNDPEVERLLEFGAEAVPAVEQFIADVNSGTFKPRTVVKEFEKLVDKYKI